MTRENKRRSVSAGLWVAQGLLAALFLFAGGMKLVMPVEQMQQGPVAFPGAFLRFIGVAEVLGAIGLILPAWLRIRPNLTPLAAQCLVVIMIGATVTTLFAGVTAAIVPFVVTVVLVVVSYGRTHWAPRLPRTRAEA
jgi:uncharacterized membrane protein YphA (DoxX/SURF4 family)